MLGIFFIPQLVLSQVDFNQTPDDDLGNIEDNFQEFFFEALKQKGIENYDRAIIALQKCLRLDDTKAVVYYEMGKNYVQLKNYGAAEDALKKAIAIEPDNEWYLDELYGVYVETKDFDKAVATVKQLVDYHPDYKEDLASLYMRNQRFREALEILDELDKNYGVSESRDKMRNDIYNATGADNDRIAYLEERLKSNPKSEYDYLNLIYRYSEQGNKTKAFEIAERLLQSIPDSELVHLALYKFYLDSNEHEKAITSMQIVLNSAEIKPDAKAKVLNDFVAFVRQNPSFENRLLEVTTEVVNDDSGKSDAELAYYYYQKGEKQKALEYYEKAYEKESQNLDLLKNILLLQIDLAKFDEAISLSMEALDLYPSQPIFYLANGVANIGRTNAKDAIDSLEMGLDYIIDDPKMEADFYRQLSLAYKMDNNIAKSETFAKKAADLNNNND